MLTFKQFISEIYLTEATAKHFSHLNLDPTNPEHKDLIDAYNAGHSSNDPNVPRHPGQIKSIDQFKNAVSQHLEKIKQKRKEDEDDRKAFESGEANVIHHNPETGAKVTQVSTQAGSCAAGAPSTWCTGMRNSKKDMVKHYDPKGNRSFIFHFPNEKKKHLRTIGAYGEYKEGSNGATANFQDAENHTVPRDEWHRLIKEHGLDKIKHIQGSVRDIELPEEEKNQYSKELTHNIKNGTVSSEELSHAIEHKYYTNEHTNELLNNPKTKPENLTKLIGFNEKTEKTPLPQNPSLSDYLKHHNKINNNEEFLHKIIKHPNVNSHVLSEVVKKSYDDKTLKMIKNHPLTDDNVLSKLANKSGTRWDTEHQKSLINHPKTGAKTLSTIAAITENPEIQKAIINHPKSDNESLSSIAINTRDSKIQKAIINHPKVDDAILSRIAVRSDNPEVHKAIVNNSSAGDTLNIIARHSNDLDVHRAIANHKNAEDNLELRNYRKNKMIINQG